MSEYVAVGLRREVRTDAGPLCGYCLSSEAVTGIRNQIEHIWPQSLDGESVRENLWMACSRCNSFKGDRVEGIDAETGEMTPLFNPRTQSWNEHFEWDDPGTHIVAKTAICRVTIEILQLNDSLVVQARTHWVAWGMHPPLSE